jgi:WD40 repeat protein
MSPDVIAAGQKNYNIFLHDLRSGGSATRLQHNDAVMDLKKMDENRLVAAGPSSLRMYDLRFAPEAPKRHGSSKAYLNFHEFSSVPFPTFDLSTELGLLASPSQDCKIQLFSLQTGLQVSSPLTGHQYSSPPSCVRFEYGNDTPEWRGPHGPSLLVGTDDVVEQWTW